MRGRELVCAAIAIGSLMSSGRPRREEPPKDQPIVLRVLGPAEGTKDVIWSQPVLVPTFAFKVIKGNPPEKGIIQCKQEDQGVTRELDGVRGQFTVVMCEGGIEMGVARVEFGGRER